MQLPQMETSRRVRVRTRSVCKTAYDAVRGFVEDDCNRLRPPDKPGVDAATKFVTVHLDDEVVVISRVAWSNSDIVRQYRLDKTGAITRRLVDVGDKMRSAKPSLSDWMWLKKPLTFACLDYLEAVRGYSPRRHRPRVEA